MHTEDLLVNDGGYRQAVEAVSESLPKLYVITSFTFIIKTVDSVNRSSFMITSKKEEIFWVLNFVSQKEADSF